MTARVLILCTGNSCRSQIAEALWRRLGAGNWESYSAGSNPAGYVHPLAIEAMREVGDDLASCQSKHLDQYLDQPFDIVVTVCGNAQQSCPSFPGATRVLHWPFDDPADATGTPAEQLDEFRRVRDEIQAKISEHLASGES